jgi:hypothetical protein
MGLKQQILAGATALKRENISIPILSSNVQYTGSIDMGRVFAITSVQSSKRCRIRFYTDSGSRNDGTELARPFISQSIPSSIGLITDINLTDEALFILTPPMFGVNLDNPIKSSIYYTIDSSSGFNLNTGDSVTVTRFLMEDTAVSNLVGVNTHETLIISASALASGSHRTGSISSPRTYLLYAVEPTVAPIRLRLYTSQSYRDNVTEISRSFGTEPASSSGLISDFYMEDASKTPMTPILIGRNDDDLISPDLLTPSDTTYYTITNGSGAVSTISASVYLFSLED